MTSHNIVYGLDKNSYQTTNTQHFLEKDMSGAKANAELMKQRGKSLKKSNFHFGHDGGAGLNQPSGSSRLTPAQSAGQSITQDASKTLAK